MKAVSFSSSGQAILVKPNGSNVSELPFLLNVPKKLLQAAVPVTLLSIVLNTIYVWFSDVNSFPFRLKRIHLVFSKVVFKIGLGVFEDPHDNKTKPIETDKIKKEIFMKNNFSFNKINPVYKYKKILI